MSRECKQSILTVPILQSPFQALLPDLRSYGGQPLFVTVRGITGCDEVLETTSAAIIVDLTPPNSEITETGRYAVEHTQASMVTSHEVYQDVAGFSTVWQTSDTESGLDGPVSVKIGSYPGGGDIERERTATEDYIRSSIVSTEGVPTYVTVTANNRAGLSATVFSEPVVLDSSSSLAGEVDQPKVWL